MKNNRRLKKAKKAISVQRIRRMDLGKDDIVVIRTDRMLHKEEQEYLRHTLGCLGVIVLKSDEDLSILRANT